MKRASGNTFRFIAILVVGVFNSVSASDLKVIDPLVPLRTLQDLESARDLESLFISVPRNGYGSAVMILSKMGNSRPPRIDMTELKCGDASLPAEVLTIRYAALPDRDEFLSFKALGLGSDKSVLDPYYDVLLDSPPAKAELLPVWLTVRIPADAKPGDYTCKLTAGTHAVKLTVSVSSWVCPDPDEWAAHVGVLMSPETLALHYNVELWSEPHWKLVEKEMKFAGGLGNDDLWVSVMPFNHLGQQNPWITFKTVDGSIVPDLRLLERYLKLYLKNVGQPDFLLLDVWNSNRYGRSRRGIRKSMDLIVDGRPRSLPLPGMKGADEVWPALMDQVRKLVVDMELPESVITLGCADDVRPGSDVNEYFKKHAPYAKWAVWTHGRGDPPAWRGVLKLNGLEVAHYEHLFCPSSGGTEKNGITGGWDLLFPEYGTARNLLPTYIRPMQYRQLPEGMCVNIKRASLKMSRSSAGFTRLCMDFWRVKVPGDQGSRTAPLLLAYENEPWSIFYRNNTLSIIEPGPDGPVGTVRYEMLREGLQECEARIAIEKALVAGRLKGKAAERARKLLAVRLKYRENHGLFDGGHTGDVLGGKDHLWSIVPDWQKSAKDLFDIAGSLPK